MIWFDRVQKTYPNGVEAIRNLDFRIAEGEFVFLMGASGAGKSTLIKLLMKEEEPSQGRIFVNGRTLSKIRRSAIQKYRRNIGVVFQDFRLLERKTVFENVAFAMEILGASRSEIEERVGLVLELMGLTAKKDEYPTHLSGGEQQRVALARAIINTPKILIADEPTGNLDPENAEQIMQLLLRINERGTTVLVATHAQHMVQELGKRVIYLDHGVVGQDGIVQSEPETLMVSEVDDDEE
ncbi:MAG: cell division ATP-binding protein FtsE [Clostridia bacterium]|nr:cell division ATP-binding protein FtsE [Clostridia bacterium]